MKSRLTKNSWVLTRPIAHRGLWDETRPENTLVAYQNAIDNNFPIEMDVQMSKDGQLYCFHDDNLKRMTGVDSDIRELNAFDIDKIKVIGNSIPTFSQFLKLVDGKVPILIEIKQQKYKGVEQKVLDALNGYKGQFVIQSFDPFIMLKIKKLAPNILRGQLGAANNNKGLKWRIVKNLSFNFLVKPDFVHYSVDGLPLSKKISNGLPIMVYTIRTQEDLKKAKEFADNFVFENLIP